MVENVLRRQNSKVEWGSDMQSNASEHFKMGNILQWRQTVKMSLNTQRFNNLMDGAESPHHLDQRRERSCAIDQFWLLCEGEQRLSMDNAWPLSALNALVSPVLSICCYRNVSLEVLRQRFPSTHILSEPRASSIHLSSS